VTGIFVKISTLQKKYKMNQSFCFEKFMSTVLTVKPEGGVQSDQSLFNHFDQF